MGSTGTHCSASNVSLLTLLWAMSNTLLWAMAESQVIASHVSAVHGPAYNVCLMQTECWFATGGVAEAGWG